jgi:hypothetical protein
MLLRLKLTEVRNQCLDMSTWCIDKAVLLGKVIDHVAELENEVGGLKEQLATALDGKDLLADLLGNANRELDSWLGVFGHLGSTPDEVGNNLYAGWDKK